METSEICDQIARQRAEQALRIIGFGPQRGLRRDKPSLRKLCWDCGLAEDGTVADLRTRLQEWLFRILLRLPLVTVRTSLRDWLRIPVGLIAPAVGGSGHGRAFTTADFVRRGICAARAGIVISKNALGGVLFIALLPKTEAE